MCHTYCITPSVKYFSFGQKQLGNNKTSVRFYCPYSTLKNIHTASPYSIILDLKGSASRVPQEKTSEWVWVIVGEIEKEREREREREIERDRGAYKDEEEEA